MRKNSITITPQIKKVILDTIDIANEYESLTSRKLGITGEIGELLVCDKLKLQLLSDQINSGHDAIDQRGKKYQIKTKKGQRLYARLSTFSKHDYDYALLGILDEKYKLLEIYKVDHAKLDPLVVKHKRRNPTVREFIKIAKRIWPK